MKELEISIFMHLSGQHYPNISIIMHLSTGQVHKIYPNISIFMHLSSGQVHNFMHLSSNMQLSEC